MSRKRVCLALQGGGSHGAFTWGVLDQLLEDGRVAVDAVSGASAGAMNATLLAYGLTVGGREGARKCLDDFWSGVANSQPLASAVDALPNGGDASLGATGPGLRALLFLTRFFSPYQLNPFDVNPLRDLLAGLVDFERLRAECRIELAIGTTRVATGSLRVFGTREISLPVLLASACLPTLHRSVEIDGEAYWDGGLSANPPLLPLLGRWRSDDVLMVLLDAMPRDRVPKSADEIALRVAEIGFAAGFQAELRTLGLARQEALRGWVALDPLTRKLRRLRLHVVNDADYMSRLAALSQANTHGTFIASLRDAGRDCAKAWLRDRFASVGRRGTVRLEELVN